MSLLALGPARAQDTSPVTIGWVEAPPLFSTNDDGEPDGFSIDLIKRVSEITGITYRLRPYRDIPTYFAAQVNGETQVLPGVATLPVLRETNQFSDPVGQTLIRLYVRSDRADDPAYINPRNKLIGVAKPSAGSEDSDLLRRNQLVDLPNDSTLLIHLLRGWIDGVVTPQERLMAAAHSIKLDHRIASVGDPIRTFDRVFAVHESRADLMPRINAAIAELDTRGELVRLQQKWFLSVPPDRPEVLTVGVADFPPYGIHNDDGTFSGFAVEIMRDLALLAGIQVTFQAISHDDYGAGPSAATYDVSVQTDISEIRRQFMDFTLPVERSELSIFVRKGESDGPTSLDDLTQRKLGVEAVSLSRRIAEEHGGLDVRVFDGRDLLLRALGDGRVDAILFHTNAMKIEIERQGVTDAIEVIAPPFRVVERAPALRFGLGEMREQLNAVIPAYLISEDYATLRQAYFGQPVFWTVTRISWASGLLLALILFLAGSLLWQRQQQRRQAYNRQQRELAREQAHAEQLGKLVTELERSNRELDEFAYTASHDLKEPLRGIAINVNLLSREEVSDKARERIDRMVELTRSMEQLISDLLYYSRLGRGEKTLKDVDPAHIVEGIGRELDEWMTDLGGEVVVASELPWLHAEGSKVKTVLQNLIVNGLKYNDADRKTVEVGFTNVTEVRGTVMRNVFYVRDNGIGIADANRERIFRIFSRLNPESAYGPGTGAGLSFVRKIVEEYDGELTFTSQPGQGTTFFFSLPLSAQAS